MAVALVFVAYTGYGRIATLAEEVREPRGTIPLAVYATVGVTVALYAAVAAAAVHAAGSTSSGGRVVRGLECCCRWGSPGT